MDGLLAHFHFEGIGIQLVTCCYIRVIHNHFEIEEPVSYNCEKSLPAGKSLTRELVLFR
jgi:hypothetical protein